MKQSPSPVPEGAARAPSKLPSAVVSLLKYDLKAVSSYFSFLFAKIVVCFLERSYWFERVWDFVTFYALCESFLLLDVEKNKHTLPPSVVYM